MYSPPVALMFPSAQRLIRKLHMKPFHSPMLHSHCRPGCLMYSLYFLRFSGYSFVFFFCFNCVILRGTLCLPVVVLKCFINNYWLDTNMKRRRKNANISTLKSNLDISTPEAGNVRFEMEETRLFCQSDGCFSLKVKNRKWVTKTCEALLKWKRTSQNATCLGC